MLPSHVQNVSCILYCASFKRKEEYPSSYTVGNQLSIALLSPSLQPFIFSLLYHMPFTNTCSCLCALLSATSVPLSLVASLFLSRFTLRVVARCAHLRKCARPKSAQVCGSVQKNAVACAKARANEPSWRSTAQYTCTYIGRKRIENQEEAKKRGGDRQAARSLVFTRSVLRWKHLRYREADLN